MERDRQCARRLYQGLRLRTVDRAVRMQRADHHTIGAELAGGHDVTPHDVELDVGVDEATTARADDDEHRNRYGLPTRLDHPGARRRPAVEQRVTQLEPPRAAAFGCHRRFHGVYTRLDQYGSRAVRPRGTSHAGSPL